MPIDKKLIHTVFAAQAESVPDAIAIEENDRRMTYAALDQTANRIASSLTPHATGVEPVVALFLPSGIPLVTAIIGSLKAGAVFMPIDPAFPSHRIGAMLTKGEPVALVTTASLLDEAAAALALIGSNAPLLLIDNDGQPINGVEGACSTTVGGDSGCYLLFTSGSTGEPKGILGQNKGLSHFVHWEIKEFGLGADERVALLAPPTFDVSLRDIFVPLIAGGTVVIPPADIRSDAGGMVRWLDRSAITTLHIVPSLFRLMMRHMEEDRTPPPQGLRRILLAGETLYGADVALWRKVGGETRAELVNLYGPSETTLAKVFNRIDNDALFKPKEIVPLGMPIANTAVLILRDGKLCDIGQLGEIFIKTPFRSKGYFGDPKRTAEVFTQNPLVTEPDILYKTGDMGRYRPDRSVDFIGRADRQVKVNGVRIEPGEIEQAARELAGLREVAVTPHSDDQRELRLALYYTADEAINDTIVREHLATLLPATMTPAWIVRLDAMPLNLHGKVDRAALPQPEDLLYANREVIEPRNNTEQILAAIWRETLNLSRVSVMTPFVELGGDSLKAIRVVSRMSREFGVETPLRTLFDHPTIAALADVVERLGATTATRIEPTPDHDSYPLSAGQMRLFTLDQMETGSIAYNMLDAFEICGAFDVTAFGAALDRAVVRHESLRTTFHLIDGEPRQVIHPPCSIPLVAEKTTRDALDAVIAEEARTPFHLDRLPLLRGRILSFSDDHHALVLTIHHIVADGWSLGILGEEVMADYDAILAAKEMQRPPLPIQYRDYAVWQQGWLASDAATTSRAFWLDQFAEEPPTIALPTDFPRPALQTFNGATLPSRSFSPAARNGLKRLGVEGDASLFMILAALVTSLLHRYTAQDDIVIGSPVAGRVVPELEQQVGLYINMAPLRTRMSGGGTFAEILASVRQTATASFDHQDYPFDRLVEELGLTRDASRSPLFDVMVALQNMEMTPLELAGAVITPYPADIVISRNDLTFIFVEEGDDLRLDLNFNTDLFRHERMRRMLDHFMRLTESLVADPHTPISLATMLTADEERQVIETFNQTTVPHGSHRSVLSLFTDIARRHPDAPACIDGDRTMTYATLDKASDRLASVLLPLIQKETPVAVSLERSSAWVIATLAVMKAGGVYLPLPSDLPEDRVAMILEDSGATIVIGAPGATIKGIDHVISVDAVPAENTAPLPSPGDDDLAYMIFTSGSTGRPKGVAVRHGGLVNMAVAQMRIFGLSSDDRVLQFATPSFDASLSELFMALLSGGALVIADRRTIEYPPALHGLMERIGVTVATFPPSFLRALDRHPLPSLRVMISAGEAAVADDLRHYAAVGKRVFNAYGPTECSVCATIHTVDPSETGSTLPVGRPIDNTEVYILNDRMAPEPVGGAGEICLAGAGLARGYVTPVDDSPFVPHPFKPGQRLYRTGDRGRWTEAGEIEFLGRIDHQVKLRGYRIELDEIKSALESSDAVGQASVSIMPGHDGSEGTLVAHYTERRGIELWPSVAEFFVYDEILYKAMYGDQQRNSRYRAAFEKVLPGKTVVEIGPGPELVLSRMALDAGAAKVYAIEILEETYRRASARIEELGLGDRITLIHGDARSVNLPEQVDYCISEIVGGIGGSEGAAAIINDARRFLNDPSAMLPQRTLTRIGAISLPPTDFTYGFSSVAGNYVEKIFEQVGRPFDLRVCLKNIDESPLLTTTDYLEILDHTLDTPLEEDRDIRLEVIRPGLFTGLLVWLRLCVDDDEIVDVIKEQASWLPVYFPLFDQGIDVARGDVIDLSISRRLCENGLNPDYHLSGGLIRANGERTPITYDAFHMDHSFRRTPFYQKLFDEQGGYPTVEPTAAETLRAHLERRLPSYMIPTHFMRLDAFPVTRNGKIDRKALPSPVASTKERMAPTNGIERLLADLWSTALGGGEVGVTDDFFALGGDSIKAIRIVSRLRAAGYKLEVRDLFSTPTIRELAPKVSAIKEIAEQGAVTGPVPLGPIQSWFFHRFGDEIEHFNQAVTLRFVDPVDPAALQSALSVLVTHHDMLRSTFPKVDGHRPQIVLPPDEVTVVLEEYGDGSVVDVAHRVNGAFDLTRAPLLKAALVSEKGIDYLVLAIHHLVVDTFSWSVLLEDLTDAYRAALSGERPSLPPKTDRYGLHTEQIARSLPTRREREFGYWNSVVTAPPPPLPSDHTAGVPLMQDVAETEATLDEKETSLLLSGVDHAYHTRIDDILLTAVARAIRDVTGVGDALVTVEGHGRESEHSTLDLGRTVGWFTAAYPVRFRLTGDEIGDHIITVKESLRQVPDHGIGYHALGYLARNGARPLPDVETQIGFNYLGEIDVAPSGGPFVVEIDDTGKNAADTAPRPHPIDVQAMIIDKRLQVTLTYCGARYLPSTATRFLNRYMEELRRLIIHCAGKSDGEKTASDFTWAGLSVEQLDDIFSA